jgi:hypothetical protein
MLARSRHFHGMQLFGVVDGDSARVFGELQQFEFISPLLPFRASPHFCFHVGAGEDNSIAAYRFS